MCAARGLSRCHIDTLFAAVPQPREIPKRSFREGITGLDEVTAVIVNSSLEQAAKDKSLLLLVRTILTLREGLFWDCRL